METEKNKEGEKGAHVCHFGGGICNHGACGCGEHHKHIMKGFLKLAIAVILFCFAFQMGELKGMLRSEHMRGYDQSYGADRGGVMMQYRTNGTNMMYGTTGTPLNQ